MLWAHATQEQLAPLRKMHRRANAAPLHRCKCAQLQAALYTSPAQHSGSRSSKPGLIRPPKKMSAWGLSIWGTPHVTVEALCTSPDLLKLETVQ